MLRDCERAGSLFWILEAPVHQDYDGYAVYDSAANYVHNPQKPNPLPPSLPPCTSSEGVTTEILLLGPCTRCIRDCILRV
jgi:hypothetical protein